MADVPKTAEQARNVQFTISVEDAKDFLDLVGEGQRAPIAKMLFIYGLNHSGAAFAEYATPHEDARKRRLSANQKPSENGP